MNKAGIDTRLVYGFLDAGKSSYIQECILNDTFYKHGTTLILCFEQGEAEFDEKALAERNASVAYHDREEDVSAFCTRCIEAYRPDRIYVEMNAMMQDLPSRLPESMRVSYAVTWIDWQTLPVYYVNFTQMIREMVSRSQQVVFRGCPAKELLEPYSQAFRLMNQKASYLRQDPMGYHEKAFDLFLPFSPEDREITVTEDRFVPLWLDALDHPERYEGKRLRFTAPLELRQSEAGGPWRAGRVVMACCMADLQFMAFELASGGGSGGWAVFDATAHVGKDAFGQRKLILKPDDVHFVSAPGQAIIDLRRVQ